VERNWFFCIEIDQEMTIMMPIWFLFLVVLILAIVLTYTLETFIKGKSSTEVMTLGILFVLTGGVFLIEPNLPKTSIIISIELGFVLFGFIIGLFGFFKR
jgi:hypothetical protein